MCPLTGVKSDFGSTRKVMATSADAAYFRYLHGVHADVTGKTSTVAEVCKSCAAVTICFRPVCALKTN